MKRTLGIIGLTLTASLMGCNSTDMQSNADKDAAQRNMQNMNRHGDMNGMSRTAVIMDGPRDPDQMTGEVTTLQRQDQYFVAHAAAGGAYEIRSSKLALNKSNDQTVKNIAQRLIDDHTNAGNQLATLADSKGMHAMFAVTPDQQKMIDKLNGLSGASFDHEYLMQQDQAHKDTIILFQQEQRTGKDPDVRKWAVSLLNTLGDHEKMIEDAQKGMNMDMNNP